MHEKIKHIDVDVHIIKGKIVEGVLVVKQVRSQENLKVLFTNFGRGELFEFHISQVGHVRHPHLT